jgi:hypothetical protein
VILVQVPLDQREVAVLISEFDVCTWNLLCEPLCVPERDESVLTAVHQEHRRSDRPGFKPPSLQPGDVVLPPSFDTWS